MQRLRFASVRFAQAVSALLIAGAASWASPVTAQQLLPLQPGALRAAWLVPTETPRTEIELVVLAGARDNPGVPGLAHYAEHLVWLSAFGNGAKGAGRHSNASTDRRLTRYRLAGPREELGEMLAAMRRVLEPVDLPERFMQEEIGIVQREYDVRVREAAGWQMALELGELQHDGQWPARSVIGTPETIAALTPAAGIAWQAATHRTDNSVLLVHGDHRASELEPMLREHFAQPVAGARADSADRAVTAETTAAPLDADAPGTAPAVYRLPAPANQVHERVASRLVEPQLQHSRLARLDRPQEPNALGAQLDVLWAVLDGTRAGGLAGPLRFDDFVARGFDLDLVAIDERHIELLFTGWPDRGVDNATLLERLEATLHDSARAGIPADTFERARARLLDDVDTLDAPDEFVLERARASISLGASPVALPAWRELLAGVTLAQTNTLLRTLADAPRVVTFLIEPGETR